MLIIKLIQSMIKALHSEGTPGQVAAGIALGAILGLTPLVNLHNLVVFAVIVMFNVSFPGAMLGWALFTPLGFALDPMFDAIGHRLLLDTPSLTALWTSLYNVPVMPLTNFNNTVVLGSLLFSLVLLVPLYSASRWGVTRYRSDIMAWFKQSALHRFLSATRLIAVYRLFRPDV